MKKITSFLIALIVAVGLVLSPSSIKVNAATTDTTWKMLVIINPNVQVDIQGNRYVASIHEPEITKLKSVVGRIPNTVKEWSNNTVNVDVDVVVDYPGLTTMSKWTDDGYWVSPTDVKGKIDVHAPKGKYDSIITIYRTDDMYGNVSVPSGPYWGLGMGPTDDANGATYAAVRLFDSDHSLWYFDPRNAEYPEEVFIHEWLHGVEQTLAQKGYAGPWTHDAEEYGYTTNNRGSWNSWYRDLMQGNITDPATGKKIGITPDLWKIKPTTLN
ncbi:MAG: hypothetical protein ACRC68_17085 [Clostridium sp.]